MPEPAQTRPYDSVRRREQSDQTRARILEAAERRFLDVGFTGASVASIATEADVSLRTVYLHFASKAELLRALWNLRLRGGSGDAPVGLREWFLEAVNEPDPARQLELNMRNSRAVKERVGGLFAVIRGAATASEEVSELWERIGAEFYANQLAIAQSLENKQALRSDRTAAQAADILWSLNHPDYFELMTAGRGWTVEDYERWLNSLLRQQLLG